jgi:transposase
MATQDVAFAQWLQDSAVAQDRLTAAQQAVLQAAWQFLNHRGRDYFSVRLLSHVLLHAGTGLKVAQLARLLGISRSAASAQQGLSSKEAVQAAHQRLAGRAHGKLLPRYAGPIARFLHEQPQATRWDLLDFIQRTWGVSVSRMALHKFLKKYGLDAASQVVALPTSRPAAPAPQAARAGAEPQASPEPAHAPLPPTPPAAARLDLVAAPVAPRVSVPPRDFFSEPPSTPAPSCYCPQP